MGYYRIKNFLINGIKGLLLIYIQIIIITSILYIFGVNIDFNTNEFIGVNLLSINIEKSVFNISVKPWMSFIIFIISGVYLNDKNMINRNGDSSNMELGTKKLFCLGDDDEHD